MTSRPLLSLRGLRKRFGAVDVLHGIDLDVMPNEFLTILGPSGSGKTTVLRLIGGFEEPSGGRILLDGADIVRLPINRRPFNTVFQDYALFPHMSARDNVSYGLRIRNRPKEEIRRKVDAVLAVVGLDQLEGRYPAEMSGGQRQRVALARAIVLEPRLILLDEPLAALDVELRGQMQRFLKDLQRRLGISFLFITHDQEEALTLADRIVVMRDGRIEQTGSPERLYRRPETRFVAGFLGENNLIPGRLVASEAGRALVDTALGRLACRSEPAVDIGAAVLVAVRPEALCLAGSDGVPCHVQAVRFAGASLIAELTSDAGAVPLRARLTSRSDTPALRSGDPVTVDWAEPDASLIVAGAP